MFTDTNILQISDLVKDQFPAFYKEQGPAFIDFLKVYYEWMEAPDNPIGVTRSRYGQYDIDTAADTFLKHYQHKYMNGLPPELLGNQRLLQKHILELYRSKGADEGIRLLFRLLFNEDISLYVPSYDIFKLSDNTWSQPFYLEVTNSPYFDTLIGLPVSGSGSHATAIVENFEKRFVNGAEVYVLYVSNVRGEFRVGDTILSDGLDPLYCPVVKGSVVALEVISSSPGVEVGDVVVSTGSEKPIKAVVSDTYSGSGTLTFEILDGGTYYSKDAFFILLTPHHEDLIYDYLDIDIDASTYGFPKLPSANVDTRMGATLYLASEGDDVYPPEVPIAGSGTQIRVLSLANTQTYFYNQDEVELYLSTELDANTYDFPKFPDSNIATVLIDSLEYSTVEVGTITAIQIINPGVNYSGNVEILAIDPYTSGSGILDSNGNFVGLNAKIVGVPIVGDSLAKTLVVQSTGMNNIENTSNIEFISQANSSLTVQATPIIGGIGWDEGYYENTKSFLSDDKYLFDGHYYQDFSYVIRASMTLDKYVDVLKAIVHPAGNAVYGDINITTQNQLLNNVTHIRLRQIPE